MGKIFQLRPRIILSRAANDNGLCLETFLWLTSVFDSWAAAGWDPDRDLLERSLFKVRTKSDQRLIRLANRASETLVRGFPEFFFAVRTEICRRQIHLRFAT